MFCICRNINEGVGFYVVFLVVYQDKAISSYHKVNLIKSDGVPEYLLPGVEVLKSLPASVADLQNQENNFLRALVSTLATLIQ